MEIQIKSELLPSLQYEAWLANRSSEDYIIMIIEDHLTTKRKNRLLEKIDIIWIDNIEPTIDIKKMEVESMQEVEETTEPVEEIVEESTTEIE